MAAVKRLELFQGKGFETGNLAKDSINPNILLKGFFKIGS
jgi:hypothetical protein